MEQQAKLNRLIELEKIVQAEIDKLLAAEQRLGKGLPIAVGFSERSRTAAEGRLALIRHQQERVRASL